MTIKSLFLFQITDNKGLKFKQCTYNWWDHSLAIGRIGLAIVPFLPFYSSKLRLRLKYKYEYLWLKLRYIAHRCVYIICLYVYLLRYFILYVCAWFKTCSLFSGEILFLLWGVRVCYRVRHAESLYNEARLISIAIYNIFTVNSLMIAFQ